MLSFLRDLQSIVDTDTYRAGVASLCTDLLLTFRACLPRSCGRQPFYRLSWTWASAAKMVASIVPMPGIRAFIRLLSSPCARSVTPITWF